jgi:hypothetical protein
VPFASLLLRNEVHEPTELKKRSRAHRTRWSRNKIRPAFVRGKASDLLPQVFGRESFSPRGTLERSRIRCVGIIGVERRRIKFVGSDRHLPEIPMAKCVSFVPNFELIRAYGAESFDWFGILNSSSAFEERNAPSKRCAIGSIKIMEATACQGFEFDKIKVPTPIL